MRSFTVGLLAVVAVLSLTCNVFLYLRYSSNRPLVTVGKEVITRKQFQDQLESQLEPTGAPGVLAPVGQQVLSKMVFAKLVAQAAARQGVTPPAKLVDDQISDIQRRSPQLLTPYAQDPARMAQFRQDLQSALALESLRIKDVALSPTQVAEYYAANSAKFALPQQVQATTVVTRNPLDRDTALDLLRQKTPLDVLARQPRLMVVGVNGSMSMDSLPLDLKKQISDFVQKAKVSETKTFTMETKKEGTYYLTFQVMNSSRAMVPVLKQKTPFYDKVDRQARSERAPKPEAEIARLYQAAKPTFNSDKYAAYFSTIQGSSADSDASKKTASDR